MSLETIEAAVTRIEGVIPSAITAFQQIAEELRQCADPAAAQALADRLDAKATDLANAIAAPTPPTP